VAAAAAYLHLANKCKFSCCWPCKQKKDIQIPSKHEKLKRSVHWRNASEQDLLLQLDGNSVAGGGFFQFLFPQSQERVTN
jgi:hypothetical protein